MSNFFSRKFYSNCGFGKKNVSTHSNICLKSPSRNAKYKWNVPLKRIYWSIFYIFFFHFYTFLIIFTHTKISNGISLKFFSQFHSILIKITSFIHSSLICKKTQINPVYLDEDGNVMSACPRRASTSHTAKPTKIVPIPPVNSCFVFNQTNRWQKMQLQFLSRFFFFYLYI